MAQRKSKNNGNELGGSGEVDVSAHGSAIVSIGAEKGGIAFDGRQLAFNDSAGFIRTCIQLYLMLQFTNGYDRIQANKLPNRSNRRAVGRNSQLFPSRAKLLLIQWGISLRFPFTLRTYTTLYQELTLSVKPF